MRWNCKMVVSYLVVSQQPTQSLNFQLFKCCRQNSCEAGGDPAVLRGFWHRNARPGKQRKSAGRAVWPDGGHLHT